MYTKNQNYIDLKSNAVLAWRRIGGFSIVKIRPCMLPAPCEGCTGNTSNPHCCRFLESAKYKILQIYFSNNEFGGQSLRYYAAHVQSK